MKEIYYTILTQAIQMGGGLLVFKILTSKLSSLDFGIYALILSFSAIIFTFPLMVIVAIFSPKFSYLYSTKNIEQLRRAFHKSLTACIFSALLCLIAFFEQ